MKKVKIISYASDICWWIGALGRICEVMEIYEPTGYIKIKVTFAEKGFEDEPFEIMGWIEPTHVVEVNEC